MPKRRRQTSTWKRILTFCYARATHTTSKLRDGLNTVLSGIFVRVVFRRHGSVMSCAQQDASWRPTVRTVVQARLGRLEDRNLVVRQANVIRCHSRRPPELFYLSSYPRFHWQIKMFIWYCLPVRSLAAIRHAPSSLHYRNRHGK